MPFEIFPQSVTLYPQDVQTFTLRTSAPPVLFSSFAHNVIQADGTVDIDTGNSDSGLVVPSALEGVAGIRWAFDPDMLPTSTGDVFFLLTGSGSHSLRVRVQPTSTVVTDENNNTLDTISRTVASGDVYYLEVAGNILRLYINGVLETEYTAVTSVRYPLRARVDTNPPFVSGAPHLTAPTLIGIWGADLASTVDADWTLAPSSGGTFNDSTDVWSTIFTVGAKPGVYELTAQVGGTANQETTATVIVEPLSILGETTITLDPGEVVTFRTNYDNAQNRLVTWSVVSGGGSFTNGQYTAPTAPASPIVKAVYGDQEARINITILAVMTITVSGANVEAATPGEVLTLTTNMAGTVNWTASVGSLSAPSGSTVTWTAPNQSGLEALITATNGTYTVTATIPTLKAFPYKPNLPLKWEAKKTVLVSQSENRRKRASRVKNYNNEPYETHELTFINRNLSELDAARTFWEEHYPNKRFILTESHRGIRLVLWFDSDIAHNADATCATTYTFRAIEG